MTPFGDVLLCYTRNLGSRCHKNWKISATFAVFCAILSSKAELVTYRNFLLFFLTVAARHHKCMFTSTFITPELATLSSGFNILSFLSRYKIVFKKKRSRMRLTSQFDRLLENFYGRKVMKRQHHDFGSPKAFNWRTTYKVTSKRSQIIKELLQPQEGTAYLKIIRTESHSIVNFRRTAVNKHVV